MIPNTKIRRVFIKVSQDPLLFQEVINHMIVFRDNLTGNTVEKLDKQVKKKIYKPGSDRERTMNGEEWWTDPTTGVEHRLVAIN
jgi:hypothetical protein